MSHSGRTTVHRTRGFTLIELMISMLFGLVIVGGVLTIFSANKRSYVTQEALSRVQESGRLAFELMARDIRMAGNTGCPASENVTNVLENATTDWWADAFGAPVEGFDGEETPTASLDQRVPGTDVLTMHRADSNGYTVVKHQATAANFEVNKEHDFEDDDILIVCDTIQTSVFQATNVNQSNETVVHNTGTGTSGNCTKFLGNPKNCSSSSKTKSETCATGTTACEYEFGPDSVVAKLESVAYYIGTNNDGNRSLYRETLTGELVAEELIEGIEDMQLMYGVDTSGDGEVDEYQTASAIAAGDWANVRTVQVNLLAYSTDNNVISENQTYTFMFSDTPITATDHRLRKSFTGTAYIRTPSS